MSDVTRPQRRPPSRRRKDSREVASNARKKQENPRKGETADQQAGAARAPEVEQVVTPEPRMATKPSEGSGGTPPQARVGEETIPADNSGSKITGENKPERLRHQENTGEAPAKLPPMYRSPSEVLEAQGITKDGEITEIGRSIDLNSLPASPLAEAVSIEIHEEEATTQGDGGKSEAMRNLLTSLQPKPQEQIHGQAGAGFQGPEEVGGDQAQREHAGDPDHLPESGSAEPRSNNQGTLDEIQAIQPSGVPGDGARDTSLHELSGTQPERTASEPGDPASAPTSNSVEPEADSRSKELQLESPPTEVDPQERQLPEEQPNLSEGQAQQLLPDVPDRLQSPSIELSSQDAPRSEERRSMVETELDAEMQQITTNDTCQVTPQITDLRDRMEESADGELAIKAPEAEPADAAKEELIEEPINETAQLQAIRPEEKRASTVSPPRPGNRERKGGPVFREQSGGRRQPEGHPQLETRGKEEAEQGGASAERRASSLSKRTLGTSRNNAGKASHGPAEALPRRKLGRQNRPIAPVPTNSAPATKTWGVSTAGRGSLNPQGVIGGRLPQRSTHPPGSSLQRAAKDAEVAELQAKRRERHINGVKRLVISYLSSCKKRRTRGQLLYTHVCDATYEGEQIFDQEVTEALKLLEIEGRIDIAPNKEIYLIR